MHAPIVFDCSETLTRCFWSAVLAFALHLIRAHSDPLYWLVLGLYSLDFLFGLSLAVVRERFCPDKFKAGLKKFLGYLLLILPLLLTDHFLAGNRQEAVYGYFKNWCLLYMSMIELVSIGMHLREMGVPIPSLADLKKFRGLLRENLRR
ncbi:MAG: phage holin family protein [Nitrospinales bacterium]